MRSLYTSVLFSPVLAGGDTVSSGAANNTLGTVPNLGTSSPLSSIIGLILTLAVVIILAILTIKFLAKKTQVKQTGSINVLAARQLAPNRFVEVIEVQGKRYLVGVGEQVTLLADVTDEFSDSDWPTEASGDFSQGFASALETVRAKYGRGKNEGDKQ